MDLAMMRDRFRTMVADRAQQIQNSEVDQRLNQVWVYEFPERVEGVFRNGEIRFPLIPNQDEYDLDDPADVGAENAQRIHAVTDGVQLVERTNPMELYTIRRDFWSRYRRSDLNTQTTPTGVLVSGRTITIRPVPGAAVEIAVPGSVYKPVLTADGIPNDQWADAVCLGAARKYARDNSYDDLLPKLDQLYGDAIQGIRNQSHATPTQRHYGSNVQYRYNRRGGRF